MPDPSSFTVLGSGGGPMPDRMRGQPAHLLMVGTEPVMIDCGEGSIRQLTAAGVPFQRVRHVVLSHHHFDHIGSLFAMFGLNMMTHRPHPLTIYGPPGTQAIVQGLFLACDVPNATGFGDTDRAMPHPRDFVRVVEITPGDRIAIADGTMTCCENTHYRPESEMGQPGHLSLSLRFDLSGRSVVFTGDTGPCTAVEALAKGADLLVGELVDADVVMARVEKMNPEASDAHKARIRAHIEQHHLTAEELGELATRADVRKLVAVHLTNGAVTPATEQTYLARIAGSFAGEVAIGEDLKSY